MFTQAETDRELTLWAETDRMDKPQGGTQTTSPIFFSSPVGVSSLQWSRLTSVLSFNTMQNKIMEKLWLGFSH